MQFINIALAKLLNIKSTTSTTDHDVTETCVATFFPQSPNYNHPEKLVRKHQVNTITQIQS